MWIISFIPTIDFTAYGLRKITAKQFTQTLPGQLKVGSKPSKKKKEQVEPVPPQIERGEEEDEEEEEDTKSQVSEASNSSAKTRPCKGSKQQKADVVDDNNSVTSQPESRDNIKYFCSKCIYTNPNVNKFLQHWSDVHKKTVYACRIDPCMKWYQTSAGLRQHVHAHHGKNGFVKELLVNELFLWSLFKNFTTNLVICLGRSS